MNHGPEQLEFSYNPAEKQPEQKTKASAGNSASEKQKKFKKAEPHRVDPKDGIPARGWWAERDGNQRDPNL